MVCSFIVCVESLALKSANALRMLASSFDNNVISEICRMNLIVGYYLIIALLIYLIGGKILVSQNASPKGHIACRLLLNAVVVA